MSPVEETFACLKILRIFSQFFLEDLLFYSSYSTAYLELIFVGDER